MRFELECVARPSGSELGLLTAMRNFAESEELGFEVVVRERPEGPGAA